jgi:GAF domain-containing protein
MTIQTGPRLSSQYFAELAQSLLGSQEVSARAGILANALRQALPGSAGAVYSLRATTESAFWIALGASDEISVTSEPIPAGAPLFASLLLSPQPVVYSASQLAREDYTHLHVLRTVRSIGYLPLLREGQLAGAFEIVSFADALTEDSLQSLHGLAEMGAIALSSAEQYEQQRQNQLDSIHRLTQLYDLEKSLNETLDFEPLLELIPAKVAAMLPCQAIHLWLFDGASLRLVSTWGEDATADVGTVEEPGDGYVADMAEEGVSLLLSDPDDARLAKRNARGGDGQPITNALLAPLIERAGDGGENELGVLEAVNRAGADPFGEDDLFFMNTMAETVSSALKNASLMYAEKKLEILQALVKVSSEITSTLRLDRLLRIIVNGPQAVLPFERCSIALDHRGRLQLKAISGMEDIPVGDLEVERLRELLQWLSTYDRQLLVRQHSEEPETEDPKVRAAVSKHFGASGYRALYALPLSDDEGRVGLLLYESSDPDFLDQAHIEMIKVLAGQTTVAIRNALLYREVPLIHLLEPVFQRKQAFLRSGRKRQGAILGGIAGAILLLIFCPLALRIGGRAVVTPQLVVTIAAPAEGIIAEVYAREGQHVRRGEVLAEMERAQLRIDNAQLRSPIDGVVMTPNLQNTAGEHLDAGAAFAQVQDLSSARVHIAVDQQDAYLIRPGQPVAIKLDSFPTQTQHGKVLSISPEAQADGSSRVFYAQVLLPNANGELRSGMEGRAKILAGYRPAGFVLLRAPALWVWEKLWDWIGW